MILQLLCFIAFIQQFGAINIYIGAVCSGVLMLTQVLISNPRLPLIVLSFLLLSVLFPLLATVFESIQPISYITPRALFNHLSTIGLYIVSLFFVFTIRVSDLRKIAFFFVKWSLPLSILCAYSSIQTLFRTMAGTSSLGGGSFLSCVGLTISVLCMPSIAKISRNLQIINYASILIYTLSIFTGGKRGFILAILPVIVLLGWRLIKFFVSSLSRLKFNIWVLLSFLFFVAFIFANISIILPTIYKLLPFLYEGHYAAVSFNMYTSSRVLEFESFMTTFDLDYFRLFVHAMTFGLGVGWQFSFNPGLYTASLHNSILFMSIIIGLPFLSVLALLLRKYYFHLNPQILLSGKDRDLSPLLPLSITGHSFYQSLFSLLSVQAFLVSLTANAIVASTFSMVLFLIPLSFDTKHLR